MTNLELSPTVFSILSGLIEDKVGLHYGMLDRELLQSKASIRAIEAGFDSLLDYYYFLRYDAGGEQEFIALVESIVVGETYFFREWSAIEVLISSYIVPWCAAGIRPRIWSAACASGEEALSLAMSLDEKNLLNQVEIVGTDISYKALEKARSGRFSRRSVRQIPDRQLFERYIHLNGDEYIVSDKLVKAIQWKRLNLLNEQEVMQQGVFNAILCRNVLIYFADPTVRSVLKSLSKVLVKEGVLIVGVSESLLRYGSCFIGEEKRGAFMYKKGES